MNCPHCHYLFDAKQHGMNRIAHLLLNRPMGLPNGWSTTVVCPRCLHWIEITREYGVFPAPKENSGG